MQDNVSSDRLQKPSVAQRIIAFPFLDKTKIIDLIAFALIMLFVYAATSKLAEYESFSAQIGQSKILKPYANFLSWSLPLLEFGIAFLLIVPKLTKFGLLASFTLMTIFTIYILGILLFSKEIPCSCGGVISILDWKSHLIFNIFFVIISYIGLRLHKYK